MGQENMTEKLRVGGRVYSMNPGTKANIKEILSHLPSELVVDIEKRSAMESAESRFDKSTSQKAEGKPPRSAASTSGTVPKK